ncbi:MAG: hypothetical protein HOW71_06670 [Nonomuraea sp.]|nr:hypothetical protein [Nonomuraea sp.]NUP61845.1 hypothetical protein [Nonomuraea sp.]NUS02784.1 hypothetical protein [Nonomuraea sp.]
MPDWKESISCSFCLRNGTEVAKLIAGPAVRICDQCVEMCHGILAEELPPRPPMWETMTDEDMLDQLPKMASLQTDLDQKLRECARHLNARGVSWERIGASLDMTRQSAWERFR